MVFSMVGANPPPKMSSPYESFPTFCFPKSPSFFKKCLPHDTPPRSQFIKWNTPYIMDMLVISQPCFRTFFFNCLEEQAWGVPAGGSPVRAIIKQLHHIQVKEAKVKSILSPTQKPEQLNWKPHGTILKLREHPPGFESTYRDSGNTKQFFPPSLKHNTKITILKHNIKKGKKSLFLNREAKVTLILPLEMISPPMCRVLWELFCFCICTKTEELITAIWRNY